MSDNQEFINSCKKAKLEMIKIMKRNINKSCLVIKRSAKKKCPVDMGQLRSSISFKTQSTLNGVTGIVGTNNEYAVYVHQGTGVYAVDGNGRKTPWGYTVEAGKHKGFHRTVGQKPQPFLQEAIEENRSTVMEILREGLT